MIWLLTAGIEPGISASTSAAAGVVPAVRSTAVTVASQNYGNGRLRVITIGEWL
jgi:hypothetical protein